MAKASCVLFTAVVKDTPPDEADPQRLTPALLRWAYRQGWFPMANPEAGAIEWFNPDPRAIIPLDAFHVPATLSREVRKGRFEIRCDTVFEGVMRACAAPRAPDDLTWIDDAMIEAYVRLHEDGSAHCLEAWLGDQLVGGLYGVHVGGAFFGESMFSRPDLGGTNASKVCLVHLVGWMRHRGFTLLDTQFGTEHLEQFGCIEIARRQYLVQLADAVQRDVAWGDFRVRPDETDSATDSP
ncbi:MAG: leucyl/phenylalanyl-tRNA--protein transferase [Planctomycetes bacterium]|nr:leucyl/phenylalanyl-tRNA--protein transferase [Planctomycetota bacterium]